MISSKKLPTSIFQSTICASLVRHARMCFFVETIALCGYDRFFLLHKEKRDYINSVHTAPEMLDKNSPFVKARFFFFFPCYTGR